MSRARRKSRRTFRTPAPARRRTFRTTHRRVCRRRRGDARVVVLAPRPVVGVLPGERRVDEAFHAPGPGARSDARRRGEGGRDGEAATRGPREARRRGGGGGGRRFAAARRAAARRRADAEPPVLVLVVRRGVRRRGPRGPRVLRRRARAHLRGGVHRSASAPSLGPALHLGVSPPLLARKRLPRASARRFFPL